MEETNISYKGSIRYISEIGINKENKKRYIFASYVLDNIIKMKLLEINISDNINDCYILSELNNFNISNSIDIINYDKKECKFRISLNEEEINFIKDICFASISYFVDCLVKHIPSLKSKKKLIAFSLIVITATFFYIQSKKAKKQKKIDSLDIEIDISVLMDTDFSNIKDIINYLIYNKITIIYNGKNYSFIVPVTMSYTFLIEKVIFKHLILISQAFSKKLPVCNNKETSKNEETS